MFVDGGTKEMSALYPPVVVLRIYKFMPGEVITVPELVLTNDANMGGVDHMDQLSTIM